MKYTAEHIFPVLPETVHNLSTTKNEGTYKEPNIHQSMCPADFVDEPPGEILFLNFKFTIKSLRVLRKVLTNFRTCTVADPGFLGVGASALEGVQKSIIWENIC